MIERIMRIDRTCFHMEAAMRLHPGPLGNTRIEWSLAPPFIAGITCAYVASREGPVVGAALTPVGVTDIVLNDMEKEMVRDEMFNPKPKRSGRLVLPNG